VIIGIGIDVLEVARMERDLRDKEGLAKALFTEAEALYCRSKRYPAQHFAARFCAKEALFKALGTGKRGSMSWKEIEILGDEKGKPVVTLSGAVKVHADGRGVRTIFISLSHTKEYAVATVILEK
jgi:holo-[acyl-carrier protein] synthase